MKRASAILPRPIVTRAVEPYAVVIFGLAAALGLSLVVQHYAYPRPLFLLALLLSAWGRGLGPSLLGAALATVSTELLFPEWRPPYGIVADVLVFGLAAVASSALSGAKLRTEAKLRSLLLELEAREEALSRAEQSSRESEARFQNLADSAPVLVWMSGLDGACTYFNRPWLDFRGRSLEQELGNGWSEGVHPDDLPACLETYRSAFAARRPFTMEYRLLRGDGEYRWVLDNGVPLHTREFTGFIGSCIDVTNQKLVHDRLRASELRLIDAQRLAQVGSWERYLEGGTIYWSDEALRILGRTADPPANFVTFLTSVHPDDSEKIKQADRDVLSGRAPVVLDYRIIRPDGELRHVRSVVELVPDSQGRRRVLGATQDVTEHLQALEQLQTSEERLRNAQRLAHLGHWEWDIKANRVSWSEETYRIFGEPQDFSPGYDSFFRAVQLSDRDRMQEDLKEALAGTRPYAVEFQIVRPDGDVRTVASVAEVLRDEAGSPVRMFGACQDITEKKQEEEERSRLARLVEKEHERLNAIISSIPGAVWETRGSSDDPAKHVTFMSDQMEKLLGYAAEEWMTTPGLSLSVVHPEDRGRFAQHTREIYTSEKGSGSHEFRCLTKDGRTVWMESHVSVIRDAAGKPDGLRGVTIDISKSKAAQAALRKTREELTRVARAASMGEVAASIAHEINQPLAAIVTNGEACLRWLSYPPNTDKANVIISSIIRDANRAGEVIRGIRALLTHGESRTDLLDFSQLTQETVALLHEHAQSHDVQLRANLEPQLPRVFGDRIQLQQVLFNLMLNGIEATRRALPNRYREVIVTTTIDTPAGIRLEVADCGPGIRPGDLERIFRPFFTTKEGGLGMGLSICRTIVESHGGRIWVASNEPRGARFCVHLPNG